MKKYILTVTLLTASMSACTFNVSTGTNNATTPASNAANSAPNTAENKPAANQSNANKATAPTKKEDSETTPKSNSTADNPKAEAETIQFPKGATDVTLERTIAPGISKIYTFNAKKGQHIWLKATESTNQLRVEFNKNPVKLGEEIKQMLDSSGEWAFYVDNRTEKPLKYTLWIGIE